MNASVPQRIEDLSAEDRERQDFEIGQRVRVFFSFADPIDGIVEGNDGLWVDVKAASPGGEYSFQALAEFCVSIEDGS